MCACACACVCIIIFQNMLQAKIDELIKSAKMAESIVQQNGKARIKEVCNYTLYRIILYSYFQ